MNPSILIAGIGNIFEGDDAFGVVVAQKLAQQTLPDNVRVADFGIRGIDLAFAFLEGPGVTILVDATARGGAPGTLYLIEPDLTALLEPGFHGESIDSHRLDPLQVLRAARSMGAEFKRTLLVGCEPAELDRDQSGAIGLSEAVAAAVDPAIEMIRSIVQEIQNEERMYVEREA